MELDSTAACVERDGSTAAPRNSITVKIQLILTNMRHDDGSFKWTSLAKNRINLNHSLIAVCDADMQWCFTQPDKASEWKNVLIIATKEVL